MGGWNIFRILGDCSHLASKCILMYAIHRNRSSEGVSMITQVLYAVVFCARYTDIFHENYIWNLFFKIFYILSSFYIIAIMRWRYPRTREREIAWKLGAGVLGGSLLLSPFVMMIFESKWSFSGWLVDFSLILESVCVLPQLLLLRQTTVPTVIDSGYILALGSYRALYIVNWIWRGLDKNDRSPRATSVIFGIIQTALYVDFAWVYYTRQRVKLRNGGVVDADDLRHGWLLNKIFGNKRFAETESYDEESAPALGGGANATRGQDGVPGARRSKWGTRGISISADDTLPEHDATSPSQDGFNDDEVDPDAKMQDPDELARALDDEDDDDDAAPSTSNNNSKNKNTTADGPSGISNGSEWRDS
ncbi:ER lumen protein retaining receptor [Apiospora saccharicola]|uniref:ER lumen protein retaining receptor n=1 Tax=Apiospora saccharicola TaxID=335842 RepID=A0ABR1VMG4_9PEZI